MDEHGDPVGLFRRDEPEKNVQGIKDRRFKMGQEGDAAENKRIPEWDGMVLMHFIKKKLLETQIKGNKVRPRQQTTSEENVAEKVYTQEDNKKAQYEIFSKGT